MAEFTEVIGQRDRMCKTLKGQCVLCPLSNYNNEMGWHCDSVMIREPEKAEEIIMKWADTHPEPIFPTFVEWQEEMFSDSDDSLCLKYFAPCPEIECAECQRRQIPAEIAAKLCIKPK